jgi:polyisoprenoid-binding protein YceI
MGRVLLITLITLMGSNSLFAAEKEIDPDRSTLTIHVGKTGLLGAAGHEHTVLSPIKDGSINDGQPSHVSFRVDAARLMVLPEDHQAEIQHSMQEKVLESARFPEISFSSDSVQPMPGDIWIVLGTLSLHGVTKPVRLSVRKIEGKYVRTVTIKQTDFGIQPTSAAGGAVKVKNELRIDFSISTK